MKKLSIFFTLFASVVVLWIAYPFIISQQFVIDLFPKGNWASRGVVGDSFGALNTLFSGLALAGLAVNIYLQSAQLKKLEKQEQENSKRIDAQVETQSLTAILNYYNSEIDRIERLLNQFQGNIVTDVVKAYLDDSNRLKAERAVILAQLRSKISQPEQGKSS